MYSADSQTIEAALNDPPPPSLLTLPMVEGKIAAGFPNPVDDFVIASGCILVVDRALRPEFDLVRLDPVTARRRWSVVLERTVRELQSLPLR